jgi:hypothetical protein
MPLSFAGDGWWVSCAVCGQDPEGTLLVFTHRLGKRTGQQVTEYGACARCAHLAMDMVGQSFDARVVDDIAFMQPMPSYEDTGLS